MTRKPTFAGSPRKRATAPARRAVGYLRTSSASNVGEDKDSDKRQLAAIRAWADRNGVEMAQTFYDAAVSGVDPVGSRPGFAEMLAYCAEHLVDLIVVEEPSRLARDLIVQELGLILLREAGIEIVAASSVVSFSDDSPTSKLIRQILGGVAEFERAMTVAKLRAARDRRSAVMGRRVEGRPAMVTPDIEARIRVLARKPKGKRRPSLRKVAELLAAEGLVNPATGKPFSHAGIALVLGPRPVDKDG